jgi:hypothetical protein
MERSDIMETLNVVILSGSCCNPILAGVDSKVEKRVQEIAKDEGLEVVIKTITISSIAFGGLGMGKENGDAVRSLISSKGMSVLPIVFFNNKIAFYGGMPTENVIREKIRAR